MPKLLVALLLLIPFSAIGLWMQDHPGDVTINWLSYRITLSHMALFVALVALVFITMIASVLIHGLWRWPAEAKKSRQLSRYENGVAALTSGLSAYAMGDTPKAQKALMKAARILPDPALPHLLAAQTKQETGKLNKAVPHFKALTKHKDTAYIGYKRLLEVAKIDGNAKEYRKLLVKARKTFPYDRWLAERYIVDAIHRKQFDEALSYLSGIHLRHAFSKPQRKQLRQSIILDQMLDDAHPNAADYLPYLSVADTRLPAADAIGQRAVKADAAIMLKPLFKAYLQAPSVPIQKALISIYPMLEANAQHWLLKRARKMSHQHSNAHLLVAWILQETEHYQEALAAATRAWEQDATKQAAILIGDCHDHLQESEKAQEWRQIVQKTADAAIYSCGVCGTTHEQWQLVCKHCEAINTVSWQSTQQILNHDPSTMLNAA